MAYYRRVKTEFGVAVGLPGDDTAGIAYPPVGTYPEPVEHCDVCRWNPRCRAIRRADDDLSLVAGATSRQRKALKARGVGTRRGLAGLELPMRPAARGRRRGVTRAGARAGPHPGRGRGRGRGPVGAAARRAHGRTGRPSRGAASWACRSRAPTTCSSTSRATRSRSTTAWTTCSGSWSRRLPEDGEWADPVGRRDPEVPRDLEPRRARRGDLGRREGRVRADDRPDHRALGAGPLAPRLPLRRVRADGARAARPAARHAGAGGGPAAPGRRARGPVPGRPPGHPRQRRELLDQAHRAAVRAHARGGPQGRGLEHRRLRDVAGARARRAGRGQGHDPPGDRGLQPRRRRQQLAAAGLAGGAAPRPPGPRARGVPPAGPRRRAAVDRARRA